jgi:hypothetical protein
MTEQEGFDDFSGDGKRMWVVSLHVRSAARFKEDKNLHMVASPQSTASICGVKIRNLRFKAEGGGTYVSGLTVEAAGEMTGSTEAVAILANLALSQVQICALAANAAFSEDFEIVAYAPPTDALPGRFHTQKSCVPEQPAPRLRSLHPEALVDLFQALQSHREEERIHRSMAHYKMALNYLEPWTWVLAAEHLFIATENLQQVIFKRLCKESSLEPSGEAKHKLAIANGITPASGKDRSHLGKFDSLIRSRFIFNGDDECYMDLKFASDHFEHGSRDFGQVRERANRSAKNAFGHIRKAILREIGVSPDSRLFDDAYAEPVAAWHPHFEVWGNYKHAGCLDRVSVDPEAIGRPWPAFVGMNHVGRIAKIVDDDERRVRNITFKIDGNGHSLVDGQTGEILGTRWVLPTIQGSEVLDDDSSGITIETKHQESVDNAEQHVAPDAPASAASPLRQGRG